MEKRGDADPFGSSYRHNGLGQRDERLTPQVEYLVLGATDQDRQAAYRSLFRPQLDDEALPDIRLAISQDQPLGNPDSASRCVRPLGSGESMRGVDDRREETVNREEMRVSKPGLGFDGG